MVVCLWIEKRRRYNCTFPPPRPPPSHCKLKLKGLKGGQRWWCPSWLTGSLRPPCPHWQIENPTFKAPFTLLGKASLIFFNFDISMFGRVQASSQYVLAKFLKLRNEFPWLDSDTIQVSKSRSWRQQVLVISWFEFLGSRSRFSNFADLY